MVFYGPWTTPPQQTHSTGLTGTQTRLMSSASSRHVAADYPIASQEAYYGTGLPSDGGGVTVLSSNVSPQNTYQLSGASPYAWAIDYPLLLLGPGLITRTDYTPPPPPGPQPSGWEYEPGTDYDIAYRLHGTLTVTDDYYPSKSMILRLPADRYTVDTDGIHITPAWYTPDDAVAFPQIFAATSPNGAADPVDVTFTAGTDTDPNGRVAVVLLLSRFLAAQPWQATQAAFLQMTDGFGNPAIFIDLIYQPRNYRFYWDTPPTPPPLRWRQRDDRIANAAPRAALVNGPRSRQHSLRFGPNTYL